MISKTLTILYLQDNFEDDQLILRELSNSNLHFQFSTKIYKEHNVAPHTFSADVILARHQSNSFLTSKTLKYLRQKNTVVPIIIITTPSTEEQALQLLDKGADDYVFIDRLARLPHAISSAIKKNDFEKKLLKTSIVAPVAENANNFCSIYKHLFLTSPTWNGYLKGRDFIFETVNSSLSDATSKKEIIGKKLIDIFPEFESQDLLAMLGNAYKEGKSLELPEIKLTIKNGDNLSDYHVNFLYQPDKNKNNEAEGFFFYGTIVTDYVARQKKAEENERKYRQIVETAQEGIWLIDERNVTTFVNLKMCEMIEYSNAELLGKPIQDFLNDQDRKKSYEQIEQRKKGISETHDARFITKSGRELCTSITTNPVMDVNGNYAGALAMITDITERKEWETKLLNKKEKLQQVIEQQEAILNALPPQIALLNKNGEIFTVNDAWKNFGRECGVTDDNIWIGQNYIKVSESATGEDAYYGKKMAKSIKEIISGKIRKFSLEYPCINNGQKRWFKAAVSPLMNKVGEGAVVLHIDITERKKAEELLHEKQEQLIASQRIARIGSWQRNITDIGLIKSYPVICSEEALRIMGLPEDFGDMSYEKFLEIVHPEDREYVANVTKKIFEDFTSYRIDHRIILTDGTVKWVHRDARFIKDAITGLPVKMIGTIQDITAQKLRETELQKNTLEREMLIRELIKSNHDLKQFTYITSHNFKAPLSNLIGLLGLFDYSTLTESNREVVEMFKAATNMLNKTINDLVQILIIKNNVSVEVVENDIDILFEDVLSALANEIQESDCIISKHFRSKKIRFNKSYLESILINLLSNAIKYRNYNRRLQVQISTYENSNGEIVLMISDNGLGIDLDRHGNKIFGLYQRFHGNTDSAGLGLFIAKSQITALGGSIEVQSKVDKGTSFKIIFPNKK